MSAAREKYYRMLFLTAAVYDIVLGIIFTLFYAKAFTMLGIADKLPQYGGYISLIGAFLFVIGVAYWLIYKGDLKQTPVFFGCSDRDLHIPEERIHESARIFENLNKIMP